MTVILGYEEVIMLSDGAIGAGQEQRVSASVRFADMIDISF